MFQEAGMLKQPVFVSFVMGVASGMPADPDWLPLLIKLLKPGSNFQTIAIGRENVWPLLRLGHRVGGIVHGFRPFVIVPVTGAVPSSEAMCVLAWRTRFTCPTALVRAQAVN
jgi:hypothetical protein